VTRAPTSVPDNLGQGLGRAINVGVLTACMGISMMPFIAVGVLAPLLIQELDISRATIGLLVALGSLTSGVLAPIGGRAIDRVGGRTGILFVFSVGSLSLAMMAFASALWQLMVAMLFAGACRAGGNSATNTVIRSRVEVGRRGWVTGIKQSGESIAIVVGGSMLPTVALNLGRRGALLIVAALSSVGLALASISFKGADQVGRNPVSRKGPLRPSIYRLSAFTCATGAAGGTVSTYLPLYAHERGGISLAVGGSLMVVVGLVAMVARLLWSRWAERIFAIPTALTVMAGLAALATVQMILAPNMGPSGFWLAASLFGASALPIGSVLMLGTMEESEEWNTGRATGVLAVGLGMGQVFAPPIFGWLVDRTGGYHVGLFMVMALYTLAALIMWGSRAHFKSHDVSRVRTSS